MTDEVALWKQHILERKANGQTIADWCKEYNVTKGSYHYWRRQVMQAQGAAPEHNKHTGIDTMPVVFAEVNRTASTQSALQITRQDVCIY